ncbi:MAG: leucyl/phenylalanyl-tRNA--protein transferase [Rhodospirillales bacterium]|nr:leucyl/phenylalanyl-tRNA--protein transferase [Rhodospirillales bacterium]
MSGSKERHEQIRLTPELLIRAYTAGIFPMAEGRDDPELFWVDPEMRGVLPLDAFHVPRSLRRTIRQNKFEVKFDSDINGVIRLCAAPADDRQDSWINAEIMQTYVKLYSMGFVHTVETWLDGCLVGGLYGVSIQGAFFGESMFSRVKDASKVALVHLVARLNYGGYTLLDTQFVTEHLQRFGALEIPREDYHTLLDKALARDAVFHSTLPLGEASEALGAVLQSSTQTS